MASRRAKDTWCLRYLLLVWHVCDSNTIADNVTWKWPDWLNATRSHGKTKGIVVTPSCHWYYSQWEFLIFHMKFDLDDVQIQSSGQIVWWPVATWLDQTWYSDLYKVTYDLCDICIYDITKHYCRQCDNVARLAHGQTSLSARIKIRNNNVNTFL